MSGCYHLQHKSNFSLASAVIVMQNLFIGSMLPHTVFKLKWSILYKFNSIATGSIKYHLWWKFCEQELTCRWNFQLSTHTRNLSLFFCSSKFLNTQESRRNDEEKVLILEGLHFPDHITKAPHQRMEIYLNIHSHLHTLDQNLVPLKIRPSSAEMTICHILQHPSTFPRECLHRRRSPVWNSDSISSSFFNHTFI